MPHLGLYVHIPFCASKCAYCDFASWAGRQADMSRYTDMVCAEIARRAEACGHPQADTVFFGGGTPSLLPADLYLRIASALREHFDLLPDAEWTVECNPGTLTEGFARALRDSGCTRLSMGMQAAQERLLRQLGRIHTPADAEQAAGVARKTGIRDLNLDLMLGLPDQTPDDMRETLAAALSMHPDHISCYALIPEEGTPLFQQLKSGILVLPGDDADREMYGLCRDILQKNGFDQYEISNFSRPGKECRHNMNCWKREDYLGFGCAAHSLFHNVRSANPRELDAYLAGEIPQTETIGPEEAMFEAMMLGLRLTEGVKEEDFSLRYGQDLWDLYGKRLSPALHDGRLKRENGRVFLTKHGMDVMNSVLLLIL